MLTNYGEILSFVETLPSGDTQLRFPGALVATLMFYLKTNSQKSFTKEDFEAIRITHDHLVKIENRIKENKKQSVSWSHYLLSLAHKKSDKKLDNFIQIHVRNYLIDVGYKTSIWINNDEGDTIAVLLKPEDEEYVKRLGYIFF